jgi:glycosyltransferase involved in cell wall biosynthesis
MYFFLTIFTPTYNRAQTLHRVFDSLTQQICSSTHESPVFEWLIVDDGSTDHTKNIIRKWQDKAKFPIRYFHQQNQGKITATETAIDMAKGELFLIADSDDAFQSDTVETFFRLWNSFSDKEKEKCFGINSLCMDQHNNGIGPDFPKADQFVSHEKLTLEWSQNTLGETWGAMKTSLLKKHFHMPENVDSSFIPESYFWTKIACKEQQNVYVTNRRLRIYYLDQTDTISKNVRTEHTKGLEYESLYFINQYPYLLTRYPKLFFKHLVKYALLSHHHGKPFKHSIISISEKKICFLYALIYLPALLLKEHYIKT